jgi:hypothetical protein
MSGLVGQENLSSGEGSSSAAINNVEHSREQIKKGLGGNEAILTLTPVTRISLRQFSAVS